MDDIKNRKSEKYNLSVLASTLNNSTFPIIIETTPDTTRGDEWKDVLCSGGI